MNYFYSMLDKIQIISYTTNSLNKYRHIMKHLVLALLITLTGTQAHAGNSLIKIIGDYFDSQDPCQLKNYPGGVKVENVKLLPKYCYSGGYSARQSLNRGVYTGSFGRSMPDNDLSDQPREIDWVEPVNDKWLIHYKNGEYEFVTELQ